MSDTHVIVTIATFGAGLDVDVEGQTLTVEVDHRFDEQLPVYNGWKSCESVIKKGLHTQVIPLPVAVSNEEDPVITPLPNLVGVFHISMPR